MAEKGLSPSDELIASVEQEMGCKLLVSYKRGDFHDRTWEKP